MKYLFVCLFTYISFASADDIRLKSGFMYKNVQIIEQTSDGYTKFKTSNGQSRIKTSDVLEIYKAPYDPNSKTETLLYDPSELSDSLWQAKQLAVSGPVIVTRPNLKLLPLSVVAFALSWDYIQQSSDLDDLIDLYKDAEIDVSGLESQQTRKTILGVTFLAAGIVNLWISLETVEVRAQGTSLSVAYKF